MSIFGKIFKRDTKREDITWASLSPAQRNAVARKLAGGVMGLVNLAHFGRGYEAVTSPFSTQRRAAMVETSGEDKQLSPTQRNQLVNLSRDMMRNAPERVSQDQQLRVNTVGWEGGKLYASFPAGYGAAAEEVMHYFNKVWSIKAEFTFRKNFNWILKTALTAQDVGGNVVLVFDDGILTGGNGTGRVRGFEADEIAEIPQTEFEKRFPKNWTQSRGFVYNESGMFCGLFVSTSQRGKAVFDPSVGFMTLRLDPFDDEATPNFILLGDMRRFNQGRAVSPLVSALTALVDLHETVASEAQAAKLNAQMVGQILESESADVDDDDTPGFDDREVADATQAAPETVKFTTKELKAIGAHFDKMPPGLKCELLDTKRPNLNIIAYVEHVTGVIGATLLHRVPWRAGNQRAVVPRGPEGDGAERVRPDRAARDRSRRAPGAHRGGASRALGGNARVDVAEDAGGEREGRTERAQDEARKRRHVPHPRTRAGRDGAHTCRAQARETAFRRRRAHLSRHRHRVWRDRRIR